MLLIVAFAGAQFARAQYYSWGSDAPMKWNTIRTPDVRMIYPDTVEQTARRTLFFIRTAQPDISYGFRHGPMRIPFVMHAENFRSNGLVMYLPKRVEFLTSPAIDGYSMPWVKQLVAHEYRHAVQYNNLDRGVVRVLSYLLGQQGSAVGLLFMPIWALEGDATMSETMMSSFGRGLQPSFSMGYRALESVGRDRRNIDRWFCGSYRDYIPDHYQLGYQICSYAYERYGENVWNDVVRYGVRNPYVIAITYFGLKKYYNTYEGELFRQTFDELERHWSSLPKTPDSTTPLVPMSDRNYTTYEWPLPLGDTAVLALKTDFDRPSRLVRIDPRTETEQRVAYTGALSTRPAVGGGRVWWTEYRRSKLFEQRVNSQLCYMDLDQGRPRTWSGKRNALYPTPIGDEGIAWVEYTPDGSYTVVHQQKGCAECRYKIPYPKEIHGLAWDDATLALYVIVTDDAGMWLGRADGQGLQPVTEGAYISLSNLRAGGGKLYFGSIASGKDEAHCYDLTTGREYRITSSTYGSFAPLAADTAGVGGRVLVTTYDRRGYRVAEQPAGSEWTPVTPTHLPLNVVNPARKRWDVVNLDTVRFTGIDSLAQTGRFREKRYRKVPNLVNIHSWMPVAFDPFAAIDEQNVNVNFGATLISQNLLSNTEAFASYGWNHRQGSLFKLGVKYFGLGVHFDFDASYGGDQLYYLLAARDQHGNVVVQNHAAPKKYYAFDLGTTLPLYFAQGYHTRQLSVSVGWNYSNGMVADMDRIEWDGNTILNLQQIGFREGLHKLSFGVGYSDAVRMAYRDFAPRWGYVVNVSYGLNPANRSFSDLVSLYGKAYLPGFAAHNSLTVEASYQTSVGGYRFPSGVRPLGYRSTRLIPRGFTSSDILADNYLSFSGNYQLPVWYPEGGIGSVLYFKRVRLNVGGDYARFRVPVAGGSISRDMWSVGGDIILDINVFRQPASATSTVKLSFYRPSDGGVWFSMGLGLPF